MHGQQASMSQIPRHTVLADGLHSQYATYYSSVTTIRKEISYSPGWVQAILPRCHLQVKAYMQQQNGLQAKEFSSSFRQRIGSNRRIWEDTPHSSPLRTGDAQANHQTLLLPPRSFKIPQKYSIKGRQTIKVNRLGEGGARKTSWEVKLRFSPYQGFFL